MSESSKLEAVMRYATECREAIQAAIENHSGPNDSDLMIYFLGDAADEVEWGNENECVRLARPLLEASDLKDGLLLEGGTVGIEAAEKKFPTMDLVLERSIFLFDVAERSKMKFQYWSYEPLGKLRWSGASLDHVYSQRVTSAEFRVLLPAAFQITFEANQ